MRSGNSSYLTSTDRVRKAGGNKFRFFGALVITAFLAVLTMGGLFSSSLQTKKTEAFDLGQFVMCNVLPDPAKKIYQYTQTSDLPYLLMSKSSVTGEQQKVDGIFLNKMLQATSGNDYKKINEQIIGYSLDPIQKVTDDQDKENTNESKDSDPKENYNKGKQVNPYDRFGVAGLSWTSYSGEWKYIVINSCDTDADPADPKANSYYENRLEPRDTFNEVSKSIDPRVVQFSKGFGSNLNTAFTTIAANGIFYVTKFFTVVTISLINFSFGDIPKTLGLTKLLGDENSGLFSALYRGLFLPLIVIVFVITGLSIFWKAVAKRQVREGMTVLLRSLALFIAAIVIASNPAFWIDIPNKVAVTGQSIVISTFNPNLNNKESLCSTDVGAKKYENIKLGNDEQDFLTRVSKNMSSAVGCQFWANFLVKPWVEGQFGTTWDQLWAKDKQPKWAPEGSNDLNNGNAKVVGDAAVPVGDGKNINNWAIYQISTQTNVHVPTGHEGSKSKVTSSVANDWWRIVDAMSNYQEEKRTEEVQGDGGAWSQSYKIEYTVAKNTETMPYWNDWVGNNSANRVGVAITSVLIAGFGLAAPFIFALLSAVYALGLALLMAFAPLMLLFACWADRGWEIFKGWADLVLNTVMKRIGVGLILALAITLITKVINMMSDITWIQGVILLAIVSVLLWKVKDRIFDAMASFSFSSNGFAGTMSGAVKKFSGKSKELSKHGSKIAIGGIGGGIGSSIAGGSFATGMKGGLANQFKNTIYNTNSTFLRSARNTMESFDASNKRRAGDFSDRRYCASCGKKLAFEEDAHGTRIFHGGETVDANLICFECYTDGVDELATEVRYAWDSIGDNSKVKTEKELKKEAAQRDADNSLRKIKTSYDNLFEGTTNFSNRKVQQLLQELDDDKGFTISNNTVSDSAQQLDANTRASKMKELGTSVVFDLNDYFKRSQNDSDVPKPKIPDFLKPYLDERDLNFAYDDKNVDYVQAAYAAALLKWYADKYQNVIDNVATTRQMNMTFDDMYNYIQSKTSKP